jgi:hypothetical protein
MRKVGEFAMRNLILAAALVAPAPAAADYKAPPQHCPGTIRPADSPGKMSSRRLGELPPGQVVLTVYRAENGCPKPVVVRQNVGSSPRR